MSIEIEKKPPRLSDERDVYILEKGYNTGTYWRVKFTKHNRTAAVAEHVTFRDDWPRSRCLTVAAEELIYETEITRVETESGSVIAEFVVNEIE